MIDTYSRTFIFIALFYLIVALFVEYRLISKFNRRFDTNCKNLKDVKIKAGVKQDPEMRSAYDNLKTYRNLKFMIWILLLVGFVFTSLF